jgi:hypothetical protein
MNKILQELKINETYTKPPKIKKEFSKVKDNIPLKEDFNFMADILELPQTKKGFQYLLVVVDLATDEFDIEQLKTKESKTVLKAMLKMFKRKHIKKPYASIRTDGGPEFQDEFAKYCYENSILHKVGISGRHQQMANVERLNRELGRLFNGYMNAIEEETGRTFREWVEAVPKVRAMLNDYRKKPEGNPFTDIYEAPDASIQPKYKEGDIVYRISEKPLDALGRKQPTQNFRAGDYRWDLTPRKIVKVVRYSGKVPIRYILENLSNVAYAENELKPAKEKEAMYQVQSVKAKRTVRGVKELLIKWKGYKKPTWENYDEIKRTIPQIDRGTLRSP